MSDVMVLKQIVRDGLAMAHEAIGDEAQKPGYGYGQYLGYYSGGFLEKYFGIEGLGTRYRQTENTPEAQQRVEDLFHCTVQYKKDQVALPHPADVKSTNELAIQWMFHDMKGGKDKYYFPVTFFYEGKSYALKDFIDGTPLPWDHQSKVCTQSTHSTNPVATLENALNQTDFKRKEEVMRKFKSFSSALMKSDFVPPWDESVKR